MVGYTHEHPRDESQRATELSESSPDSRVGGKPSEAQLVLDMVASAWVDRSRKAGVLLMSWDVHRNARIQIWNPN